MRAIAQPRAGLVVETDVDITMRDGVRLRADVYHPAPAGTPRAAILVRTPYGKQLLPQATQDAVHRFAGHGYTVVVQDLRGKHASEGEFRIGRGNRADGHDTLDWITQQAWSDGGVGTWGCSYLGENQVYLATTGHPALKACIPMAAGAALGTANGRYARWGFRTAGGHLLLRTLTEWYARHATSPGRTDEAHVAAALKLLDDGGVPVADVMARCGLADREWREIVAADHQSGYWTGTDYLNEGEAITAPMLVIDSWFDPMVASGLALFDYARRCGATAAVREGSRLIVAPTCHCQMPLATEHTVVGDRDVGDARLDWVGLYLAWFDRWLRGNAGASLPLATVYEIGCGRWRSEERWPPETRGETLHLTAAGTLSATAAGAGGRRPLAVDPGSPVPSLGGTGVGSAKLGAVDQSPLFSRGDVALFRSLPLPHDLRLFGSSTVLLHASSAQEDCDLFVTLLDLAPDGTAFNLQDGTLRGSWRGGPATPPTGMVPGEVHALRVEIGATFTRVKAGHCLGLLVSTTSYPNYPLPGRENLVTLHLGGNTPSRWEFSVIPEAP